VFGAAQTLPLVLRDVPMGTFNGLQSSGLRLQVYGSYAHSDIQSIIGNWREGKSCDTAKVCLQDHGMTSKHKEKWQSLHDELYQKKLVGSVTCGPLTMTEFLIM
jgi:hypothetical protein